MSNDDDLTRLLRSTAADITPQGSLEEITERTTSETSPRRWILPAVAAAAVVALVVGGVGWLLSDDDPRTSPGVTAGPAGTPTATANGPKEVDRQAPVFFVGQAAAGKRLFRDTVTVRTCETAPCLLLAAVGTAVAGPVGDPDYSTPWAQVPEHTGLVVNTDGTQIVIDFEAPPDADLPVDLTVRPEGMDALTAELAVQQLVYTARTALGEELPVRFRINGEDTPTLIGVATAEPLTAADADEIQAPVQITNLADGESVPAGTVHVRGVAAVYEGNVLWEVRDDTGAVVDHGFTTAEECCTLKPYAFTADLERGTYTVLVHDEDASGEGLPVNQDTKEIVVR